MTESDEASGGDADEEGGEVPDGDDPGHALPEADLNYPTLSFDDGAIAPDGAFDLLKDLGRDDMSDWADALAGALASHDLGVEADKGFVTLGVAPNNVEMSFNPAENHSGELEITFRLSAKAMFVDDGTGEKVGARGDAGFVPLSMLTEDRDVFRCYSWIDNPENPE